MDDAQPVDAVEDPHAACQRQVADVEAKWKRALADYQNREKELAREREDFTKFCTVGLIRDFLPIVDAVGAALRGRPSGDDAAAALPAARSLMGGDVAPPLRIEGVGLEPLHKLCTDFLKRHGVESIGVVGDRVDYLMHEVVGTRTPSSAEASAGKEDGKEAGTILEVVQAGYMMHGRLLRPARVIVAE
ncbi:nucleotide exchange factor GrpE [Candidatus Uhrbacteria bacterium]|nr:nucleotide exchange factor GrpE [Candidatus Uhrbacteria bacterium]